MKEKIKITITLTDDDIALYGENTQDLTEDDIIDIFKMLGSLVKTSSILQEGDPDVSALTAGAVAIMALHAAK